MTFTVSLDYSPCKYGGAFWTVPELLFESVKLIPALQQFLSGRNLID